MGNIHINSNGEPGECKAVNGGCPFGSEDTHFENAEAGEKGYASAQAALGNGEPGKVKSVFDGAMATPDSKEDAYRIANIIANEGKVAVVTKESVLYLDDSDYPDRDEDEDGYERALDEAGGEAHYERFDEENWDGIEDNTVNHYYTVRAFDNKDQIKEYDNIKGWADDVLVDVEIDTPDPDDSSKYTSNADFDSFKHEVTRITLNVVEPKK